MTYPDRIRLTDRHEAWIARFSGLGGRKVRIFPVGSDAAVRVFNVHGDREVALENARECARVLEER
jgi:hypothetical protein